MTLVLTVVAGLGIGLCIGALGGGGSILAVPVLVHLLHQDPQTATTASLVIVGSSALTGAAVHSRAGRVRWRAGLAFGALGVGASLLGSRLNRGVDPELLLLAFAGLMVVAAVAMLRGDGAAGRDPGGRSGRWSGGWARAATVTVAALGVGLVTGFFGVGGGFLIVPALVLVLGYEPPTATATSLPIIAVNSVAALADRVDAATPPWAVVVPFTLAAAVGAIAGSTVSDRASGTGLRRAFAVLLLAIAAAVAAQALAA